MRTALRALGLVAALAATICAPTAPASAEGAVLFTGTVHINCFGCGTSSGTAEICATGEANGSSFAGCAYPVPGGPGLVFAGNAHADYNVSEGTGTDCVVQGSASGGGAAAGSALGLVTGVVHLSFTWTRLGAIALISTVGDITGSGFATFLVTSPVGLPCGGPMDGLISGVLVGV